MGSDLPPLRPEEAAQPVNRGMLRDEMAANTSMLRDEMAANTSTLRDEMAANTSMLRDEMVAMREGLRGEIRDEVRDSESRTRILIEDVRSTLHLILERLSDAIAGNAQIARVDADIAEVRNRADAAAALGPRVRDHERRIRTLEGRQ